MKPKAEVQIQTAVATLKTRGASCWGLLAELSKHYHIDQGDLVELLLSQSVDALWSVTESDRTSKGSDTAKPATTEDLHRVLNTLHEGLRAAIDRNLAISQKASDALQTSKLMQDEVVRIIHMVRASIKDNQ